jgi:vancomycin aglycone glucosyltransferase
MRVLLTTYPSRGDVRLLVGLAVQVRALGAEVQVYAPPDQEFVELLAGVGVPPVPIGQPVRPPGIKVTPPSAADLPPARGRVGRRSVRHRRRGGRGM